MDLWFFLLEMVLLLGGAFLLGALAQRLRQSPILGYILAGTIVGPLLFNAPAVNQAAELGVSLLLFSIGLEFSFRQLGKIGRMAFGGGSVQIIATLLLVTLIMISQGGLPRALTVGAIVALSSTTVVLRLLVDRAEMDSVHGRASLGILLMQDIAIVPLVIMVSLFTPAAGDTGIFFRLLRILLSIMGLAAVCYLLLYRVAPVLLSRKEVFANRELTVLLSVAVGLGAPWAAHAAGISPALGAFMAGLLLGESPFATQIRADIGPVRIIMVTLFFASIGMLARPQWFFMHLHWVLMAATLIFLLKAVIIYGVGRLFGLDDRQAIATGIALGQIGEFSFVLAAVARRGGLLEGDALDLVISVIIVLMLATPYMIAAAVPMARRITALFSRGMTGPESEGEFSGRGPDNMVLVVGLGPAGRGVVHTLLGGKLRPVLIDVNPEGREFATQLGLPIYLGDAEREEILRHAGIMDACMAVVTVPDPHTSMRIVRMIRRLRPQLTIVARCRYNRYLEDLKRAGADLIVDEETSMGDMLGKKIIERLQEGSGAALACRLGGQGPEMAD